MQINLTNHDIEEAVRNHLKAAGISLPVTTINFTQTRNPPGISAEIQINGSISDMLKPQSGAPVGVFTRDVQATQQVIAKEEIPFEPDEVPSTTAEDETEEDSSAFAETAAASPANGKVRLFSN